MYLRELGVFGFNVKFIEIYFGQSFSYLLQRFVPIANQMLNSIESILKRKRRKCIEWSEFFCLIDNVLQIMYIAGNKLCAININII